MIQLVENVMTDIDVLILCAFQVSPTHDEREHTWIRLTDKVLTQMKPMNHPRAGAAAVRMGGALYVVRGTQYYRWGSIGGELYHPVLDERQNLHEMADRMQGQAMEQAMDMHIPAPPTSRAPGHPRTSALMLSRLAM
jgi:hypothetical protein